MTSADGDVRRRGSKRRRTTGNPSGSTGSSGSGRSFLSASALSVLALAATTSSLSSSASAAAAANAVHARPMSGRGHLPQHRVRTPRRAVSYPQDHPLSRHLLRRRKAQEDDDNDTKVPRRMGQADDNNEEGDASDNKEGDSEDGGGEMADDEDDQDDADGLYDDELGMFHSTEETDGGIVEQQPNDSYTTSSTGAPTSSLEDYLTTSPTLAPTTPIPEPIRIVPILTAASRQYLTRSQQSFLLSEVLQPAIDKWSSALRLIRVRGNLTIDRSQLYDEVSCGPGLDSGLPSAIVPEEHFHDYDPNNAGTRRRGRRQQQQEEEEVEKEEGASDDDSIGNADNSNATTTNNNMDDEEVIEPVGKGVPDADLIVYVELAFRQEAEAEAEDPEEEQQTEEAVSATTTKIPAGPIRGSAGHQKFHEAGFESLPEEALEASLTNISPGSSSSGPSFSRASNSLNSSSSSHVTLPGANVHSNASLAILSAPRRPSRNESNAPRCSPAYLASATTCSSDQFDRPVAGLLHLCIQPETFFVSEQPYLSPTDRLRRLQQIQLTVLHELGHILGFNLQSMAHFRESDGTPRTPRVNVRPTASTEDEDQEDDDDDKRWIVGDVEDQKVECTGILPPGNGNNRRRSRRHAIIPLPSDNTLRFRTARGGVRVADVVLPTVQAVVRNHFNCSSLYGAELQGDTYFVERQQADVLVSSKQGKSRRRAKDDTSGDDGREKRGDYDYLEQSVEDSLFPSDIEQEIQYYDDSDGAAPCISDHWSRRVFKSDLMNPIIGDVQLPRLESSFSTSSEVGRDLLPSVSPLTLALFADSGWYDVDITKASLSSGTWGRHAGCTFVNEKCVSNGKVKSSNAAYFCNHPQAVPSATASTSPRTGSMRNSLRDKNEPSLETKWTGCTSDGLQKATCDLTRYAKPLPEPYAYFMSSPSFLKTMSAPEVMKIGGTDPMLDYCPIYDMPLSSNDEEEAICTSKKAARFALVQPTEEFGPQSRCVLGRTEGKRTSLCLSLACVVSDRSLRIKVGGQWRRCQKPGQLHETWNRNQVLCPDIRTVCPLLWCPRDCLGAGGLGVDGICSNDGQCLCKATEAPSIAPSTAPTVLSTEDSTEASSEINSESSSEDSTSRLLSSFGEESRPEYVPCEGEVYMEYSELMASDLYVERPSLLTDTPVGIFTRTVRLFSDMSAGDVIGFLAVSVVVVLGMGIGGMGMIKAYKRKARARHRNTPFLTVRRRQSSELRRFRTSRRTTGSSSTTRFRLTLAGSINAARQSNSSTVNRANRAHIGGRAQGRSLSELSDGYHKDKATASVLVDLRANDLMEKRRQRRRELLLQRQRRRRMEIMEKFRQMPADDANQSNTSATAGENVVFSNQLPPLPQGGRVVAVAGALFIDNAPDEANVVGDIDNNDHSMVGETDASVQMTSFSSSGRSDSETGCESSMIFSQEENDHKDAHAAVPRAVLRKRTLR